MKPINTELPVGETVWLKVDIVAADYSCDKVTYKVREHNNTKADGHWVLTRNLQENIDEQKCEED